MKVVEYGKANADVVILLHGGGLSWWNYRDAAEVLADRFHVVIPILAGHAGSGMPFSSIESNAQRLIDYVDKRFAGHVLLIGGLSLGGQILVEILSRRGGICDFALVESALVLPMKITGALIGPTFSLCYPLIKRRWFSRLQFWSLKIKPELFEAYYRDTAQITKEDMIAFLAANSNYCAKATLTECKSKVLVVVGGRESCIMKRSAAIIAERLPCAEMEVLKGLHHGEFSINHGDRYADKLLHLIGR